MAPAAGALGPNMKFVGCREGSHLRGQTEGPRQVPVGRALRGPVWPAWPWAHDGSAARSASALLGRGVAPRPRPEGWRSALTTWHPRLQTPPLRSPFQQPGRCLEPFASEAPRPWGRLQNRVQCTEGPAPAASGLWCSTQNSFKSPGVEGSRC